METRHRDAHKKGVKRRVDFLVGECAGRLAAHIVAKLSRCDFSLFKLKKCALLAVDAQHLADAAHFQLLQGFNTIFAADVHNDAAQVKQEIFHPFQFRLLHRNFLQS